MREECLIGRDIQKHVRAYDFVPGLRRVAPLRS